MVAIDNPGSEMADLMRRVRFLETQSGADGSGFGGGDGDHPGSATWTVQVGQGAAASAVGATALGRDAIASQSYATALGRSATASQLGATAVGRGASATGIQSVAVGDVAEASATGAVALGRWTVASHVHSAAIGDGAETTAIYQVMLGTADHTVVVPGTFSNPSARRLKQEIKPAPAMRDVFPVLYEWEYIVGDGRRRIGPMADDLVGTDAERFLVVDDEGEPAGIDTVGLHTAQIAVLLARIESLEEELRGRRNG